MTATAEIAAGSINSCHTGYALVGLTAVAVAFGSFGIWAGAAPLDSAAIASGRVSVESSTKPVQHLEGGLLSQVLVKESQMVEKGQVLFRLQSTRAKAEADMIRKQLDASLATEARLLAEQKSAMNVIFPMEVLARQHNPETAKVIADQRRQFADRRELLTSRHAVLQARREQLLGQIRGGKHRKASLTAQFESYAKELEGLMRLSKRGYYPRNKLAAKQRERDRVDGELGYLTGELERQRKALEEVAIQVRQVDQQMMEEVSRELAQIRMQLSDLREKLTIAEDTLARIEVRAPQAGVVQNIATTALGAVIRPGDTLAEVVPTRDSLVISAQVMPTDIDRVHKGLQAEVRFPAFSASLTPTILGHVERVSADALTNEYTKDPYYEARIMIDRTTVDTGLLDRLVPGMPADVIISTGERTVLQYLVSPLSNALAKSMRER